VAALVASCALALVGCGGDDGEAQPSPSQQDLGVAGSDAGEGTTDLSSSADQGQEVPETCDALGNAECMEIQRGEAVTHRWLARYSSFSYDDRGTERTVIRLAELIDAEVTATPERFRYQVYGSDGYTFGGYATWEQLQQAYVELGSRRIIFEPALELPHSYAVKDAYLIVLSPTAG